MISLKLKYKIKCLLNPLYWTRSRITNKPWDDFLWNALINCQVEAIGEFRAIVNGKIVWIANHPYASGACEVADRDDIYCSRETAMLLHEEIPKYKMLAKLNGNYKNSMIILKDGSGVMTGTFVTVPNTGKYLFDSL